MKTLILATSNQGKIKEFMNILNPIQCIPQSTLGIDDAEETGLSFIENALLKARHASRIAKKPALADDSGLVVPALRGEPGIYSARYAGINTSDKQNMELLLKNMDGLQSAAREAFFYCAIALVSHGEDPTPIIATGRLKGRISFIPVGENGFGYDPVFYLEDYQCTAAQLPATIKNTISHRALALKQLRTLVPDL